MLPYIIRRFFNLIPVFLVASLLSFLMLNAAPGSFLDNLKQNPKVKPETIERLRTKFQLDKPVMVRYVAWLGNVVKGDFGESFSFQRPVLEVVEQPILNSLVLAIPNLILVYLIAIPIGVYGAIRQYSLSDKAISLVAYFFLGIPSFFFALIMLLLLVQLKNTTGHEILPITGMTSRDFDFKTPWGQFWDIAWHAIPPLVVITLHEVASFSRFMRGQMLEFMNQDYVRTARSKGVPERMVVYKHALRNAIVPFVAVVGGALPGLIFGVGFVEFVMNWPGIFPTYLNALTGQDTFVNMAFIAVALVLLIIGNLISDLLLAWVDPRIRYA
jgi:peptide/nickel transport system permease protein